MGRPTSAAPPRLRRSALASATSGGSASGRWAGRSRSGPGGSQVRVSECPIFSLLFICVIVHGPWMLTQHASQCSVVQYSLAHKPVGGPMPIFYRLSARIGIIQVEVDGLEMSKQHRNMHKLSTYNRSRRVTDTVPQTRSQISKVRHARVDPFRANRHAAQCTLVPTPQCHSWATLPPQHTATCKTDMHRQPEHGCRHNCAHPQPHTCTTLQHLQEAPCCPIMLPSAPPASPADTRAARAATAAEFRMPWVGIMSSWRIKPPSRRSSQIIMTPRSRRRRALTCGRERVGQRGHGHMRGSDGV